MQLPMVPKHFIPVSNETHDKWLSMLKNHGIVYLYGLFASGKTSQAAYFAQTHFKTHAYFTANDQTFLADVEGFFATYTKGRSKTLLILDDLQWLSQSEAQQRLFPLLLKQPHYQGYLQILLLSRSALPDYLTPLRMTQYLSVVEKSALTLDEKQILALISTYENLSSLTHSYQKELAEHCLSFTCGYSMWVQIYLQRMEEDPLDRNSATNRVLHDVYYQLDTITFSRWPQTHQDALTALGVFQTFDLSAAQLVLGDSAESILHDFMTMDDFLKWDDTYYFPATCHPYLAHRVDQLDSMTRTQLYQIAATYYEQRRDFAQALRCHHAAGQMDKVVGLVVYLLENAEGCVFAELSNTYIDLLTPEREKQNPSILGAKAMLAAYRMDPDMSRHYLSTLKKMAEDTNNTPLQSEALSVYIRTLIASPCVTADEMKENLLFCMKHIQKNGIALKNIMPTGNFPSVMNGGLDLLPWAPQHKSLFALMKPIIALSLGAEGIGAPDTSLGELYYEHGENPKAIASVTHALSDATYKGSIRVQYAATAVMARIFQSEGQADTAQEILQNIYDDAHGRNYGELLPNIVASMTHHHLLRQNIENATQWLNTQAPDGHAPFYTTARFTLLTKARVYTMLGRDLEALFIIERLQSYASMYHRIYFQLELLILKAIILYRRGDTWQDTLLEAVTMAQPYGLLRIFADQGIALLPLWQAIDWKAQLDLPQSYISAISKRLRAMATQYPKYLQRPSNHCNLSAKEITVLRLMADGASNMTISKELGFTASNAKFHVSNIIKKLSAENRTGAVKIAQEQGLV